MTIQRTSTPGCSTVFVMEVTTRGSSEVKSVTVTGTVYLLVTDSGLLSRRPGNTSPNLSEDGEKIKWPLTAVTAIEVCTTSRSVVRMKEPDRCWLPARADSERESEERDRSGKNDDVSENRETQVQAKMCGKTRKKHEAKHTMAIPKAHRSKVHIRFLRVPTHPISTPSH